MVTPTPWGPEFLVNTTTFNDQWEPTVTGLDNGRFVVAWRDSSWTDGDTSGTAIRAQVFNADGTKAGSEFLVNTTTAGSQRGPMLTALADGHFAAAWVDFSQSADDTSGTAICGQIFNADGTKAGSEFVVNTTTAGDQGYPSLTALTDSRFVVAWVDYSESGGDTSLTAIRAQVFNADGTKAGDEFLVNSTTVEYQYWPTLAALPDGGFVAAWQDHSQSGDDPLLTAIRAQLFSADGSKAGSEFVANTTTAGNQTVPILTTLANGQFVAAWTDWSQSGSDTSGTAIRGQIFNADGTKAGSEFVVNTTTAGDQWVPELTALPDSRFVAAWQDYSQSDDDPSGGAVRAQVFNADGTKTGSEFVVNTTTVSDQLQPTLTALADGRFVVAWEDYSQSGGDPSAGAVRAQIFDPRLSAVNVVGTDGCDGYVGTPWDDRFDGSRGNDTLDGGAGIDTATFSASPSAYTILLAPDGRAAVAYQAGGGDGLDLLTGIEQTSFAGSVIALASTDGLLEYTASALDLIAAFGTNQQAAFDHFVQYGYAEGRTVSFDGLEYIASNADLIAVFGANRDAGAWHYITFGFDEGRGVGDFDGLEYIASNSDLIAAFGADSDAGSTHYINFGRLEGRGFGDFDGLEYLASNPDLIATLGVDRDAGSAHYIESGSAEGRSVDSFDGLEYIAANPDLIFAFGANADAGVEHFLTFGYAEGRDPGSFDGLQYIASHADLIQAFGTKSDAGSTHYIDYGFYEGRDTDDFDAAQYLANYRDLRAAFGTDLDAATAHYITYGFYEGRVDDVLV